MSPPPTPNRPPERARQEADHDRSDDLEHQMSSQTPIAASSAANA